MNLLRLGTEKLPNIFGDDSEIWKKGKKDLKDMFYTMTTWNRVTITLVGVSIHPGIVYIEMDRMRMNEYRWRE